jgi:2Fe-2S ferredoxin
MPLLTVEPHTVLCPKGATLEVKEGQSLCDALLAADIEIEHACEKSAACTTCHVVIKQGFSSLNTASDTEEDLLDRAWGLTATSRLSCQAKMASSDVVIEIPKYTINHAREHH